jgi:hypothetical protein
MKLGNIGNMLSINNHSNNMLAKFNLMISTGGRYVYTGNQIESISIKSQDQWSGIEIVVDQNLATFSFIKKNNRKKKLGHIGN